MTQQNSTFQVNHCCAKSKITVNCITSSLLLLSPTGLHPDAAQWLVDHRTVFGVGIDTASIDYGQSETFGSHRILASKNAFNIENVNTKRLDLSEFPEPLLIVNPLKISTGSGSPVRAMLVSGLSFAPDQVKGLWNNAKTDL